MSRGYDGCEDRPERPHRTDRQHGERRPRGGGRYTQDYPPPPPEYTSSPEDPTDCSSPRINRGSAPLLRRRGLNEDYYNPPPKENDPPRRSRHRHGRRPPETSEDGDYHHSTPKSRPRTESRGRRRARSGSRGRRRYESDYTNDDETYDSESDRPAKPSRRKTLLNALGIGKADRPGERERGRSPYRSPSRGRKGYRDHSYSLSPSPPRRRRTMRDRPRGRPRGDSSGLKRSNTNWQRAATSAMKAGATAAFDLRHEPGPWMGPKGIKIATAAIGAAVVDSLAEDNQMHHSGSMRGEAVRSMGEAALRHIVRGGRSRSRRRH